MTEKQIVPYAKRLRAAREQKGKSLQEMAALTGISEPSYWDLESFDDEVLSCISIKEFGLLSQLLDLSPRTLFAEECKPEPELIGLSNLIKRIRRYMEFNQKTLSEFEERVGWDVATLIEGPVELVTERYNIEGLRRICKEVGVNWVSALTEIIDELDTKAV